MDGYTELEHWQMRLVYSCLYICLGIISTEEFGNLDTYTDRIFQQHYPRSQSLETISVRSSEDNHSFVTSVATTSSSGSKHANNSTKSSKRFPPLSKLIKSFKKALGDTPANIALAKWRWMTRDSSDRIVLQYLRQYKDSKKAVKAIALSINWQIQYNGERELKRGERYYLEVEPRERMIENYKSGKYALVGKDKAGHPIGVVRVNKHTFSSATHKDDFRFAVQCFELSYMACPSGGTVIFDMTNFSVRNMDYSLVKFIVENFNSSFPGLLHRCFIHNAPRVFAGIWKVVKRWIDPALVEKISFTSNASDLTKYIDIDQLPRHLGGKSKIDPYTWGYPQDLDDFPMRDVRTRHRLLNEREEAMQELEALTCDWIVGAPNHDLRNGILRKCTMLYWQLDPYVRSRIHFDRNGVFGRLRPELAPGGIAQPVLGQEHANQPDVNLDSYAPSICTAAAIPV